MLNSVAETIRKNMRMSTLRHPNAIECKVYRKTVTRVSTDVPAVDAGLPTLGGMGVMDSEDESDYEYTEIGDAMMVFVDPFQTDGGNWQDNDNSITYVADVVNAMIEPVAEPNYDGYFEPQKNDLLIADIGYGTIQSYQIAGETGNVAIPPFTKRYVLNPRQDLSSGI